MKNLGLQAEVDRGGLDFSLAMTFLAMWLENSLVPWALVKPSGKQGLLCSVPSASREGLRGTLWILDHSWWYFWMRLWGRSAVGI